MKRTLKRTTLRAAALLITLLTLLASLSGCQNAPAQSASEPDGNEHAPNAEEFNPSVYWDDPFLFRVIYDYSNAPYGSPKDASGAAETEYKIKSAYIKTVKSGQAYKTETVPDILDGYTDYFAAELKYKFYGEYNGYTVYDFERYNSNKKEFSLNFPELLSCEESELIFAYKNGVFVGISEAVESGILSSDNIAEIREKEKIRDFFFKTKEESGKITLEIKREFINSTDSKTGCPYLYSLIPYYYVGQINYNCHIVKLDAYYDWCGTPSDIKLEERYVLTTNETQCYIYNGENVYSLTQAYNLNVITRGDLPSLQKFFGGGGMSRIYRISDYDNNYMVYNKLSAEFSKSYSSYNAPYLGVYNGAYAFTVNPTYGESSFKTTAIKIGGRLFYADEKTFLTFYKNDKFYTIEEARNNRLITADDEKEIAFEFSLAYPYAERPVTALPIKSVKVHYTTTYEAAVETPIALSDKEISGDIEFIFAAYDLYGEGFVLDYNKTVLFIKWSGGELILPCGDYHTETVNPTVGDEWYSHYISSQFFTASASGSEVDVKLTFDRYYYRNYDQTTGEYSVTNETTVTLQIGGVTVVLPQEFRSSSNAAEYNVTD